MERVHGHAIDVKAVSKQFGDVTAVDDISFSVKPRELFFLLGPSGCGKTTMLRMLAGLESPDKGAIFIENKDVTSLPAHKRDTPMVFQSYALWPHMTVFDNVAFGLVERRVPKKDIAARVTRTLTQVGLSAMAKRRPGELSGGQQQRVVLARALVLNPSVMLLDEPLSNLDANLRIEMREEILKLHRETDITFIYVTHDQAEALSLADRILVMKDGAICALGTPNDLYRTPPNRFCAEFLGEANILDASAVSNDAKAITVSTGAGTLSAAARSSFSAGDALHCLIRPEHIRTNDIGGANRIDCEVLATAFSGPTVTVHLQAASQRLKAVLINRDAYGLAAGMRASFFVHPDDIILMNAGNER